jgi:hypothetical protein
MSLKRILGRASSLLILGLLLPPGSAFLPSGLSAQKAPTNAGSSGASEQDKQMIAASAIKIPLFFEANKGQTDPSVRFLTRSGGYTMFLTPTETVLVEGKNGIVSGEKFGKGLPAFRADAKNAKQSVLRMELLGANSAPEFQGLQELPGKVNYLIGKDQAAWHTNVALFSEVQVAKVYPGVDLLFHGDQRELEYDFVVAPGADAGRIGFKIRGAKKIEIDATGKLILHTADSEFEMRKPVIYQGEGASRSEVRGKFVLSAKNQVRFELGPYDHAEKLVIDPAIGYSTFLGGSGDDEPTDLAVDSSVPSSPKVYVAGFSSSITTFPAVLASKTSTIGTADGATYGFIAKIDPTITSDPGGASSLDYLTFIGGSTPLTGTSPCTTGLAKILLDSSQGTTSIQAVVTGITSCSDYPGTKIQTITGSVADVVTRLTTSGAVIDLSVLLGGNGEATGAFGSVDSSGNVLISSATSSTNLPTTTGAYMTAFNNGGAGTFDCYIAKLPRATFNPPSYLTYLNTGGGSTAGGAGGAGSRVGCGAIEDSTGKIVAGGNTVSATVFHVGAGGANLANGFQTTFNGAQDTFGMRLDPTLSGTAELLYATYYGGGDVTNATNGALDLGNGVVAIGGYTTSATTGPTAPDIPLKNAYQSTNLAASTGGETGYLVVVDTTQTGAASLLCSTYFGGSSGSDEVHAVTYDASDPTAFRIIIGGQTRSGTDFPTKNSMQTFQGVQDGYIASLKVPLPGQSFAASLYFSSYIGGGVQSSGESERISGVGVDANDTIYATGRTLSADFFANVTPPVSVNGFQTTCGSCDAATPLDDVVVFSITGAPSATLQSITVTPASASIAGGASQQFHAEGFYSDGSLQDITNTVVWVSSNTGIARMSTVTPGLATGFGAGVATITATFNTVASNAASLTVTTTAFAFNVVLEGTAYGTVKDNLGQINCTNNTGQGATGTCNTSYPSGTAVVLTQTANPGSVFASWGVPIGDAKCSGTTTTCTFTMDEQEEIAATFNNGTGSFALNVIPGATATGGGLVLGNIGGTGTVIDCTLNGTTTPTGVCTQSILSGSITTLTAEANAKSNFTSWSGPCVVPAGQPAKCMVTMGAAATVTAVFTTGTSTTPALTISKSHVGNFDPGESGATYTVAVSNTAGAGPTSGTVTVTDTLPAGLTLDSMAGTGWTCPQNSCTRSDVLPGGQSYPPITVTVEVASDATSPQINSVALSGGGSAPATATDSTTIAAPPVIAADFNVNGEGDEDKQRVDGTSKPLQVTLTNTSTTLTVHISGVTPTDPYKATTDCNLAPLGPGQSCHVFISFTPASVCQDLGDEILTVNDDDPGGNFQMTIHGWGADSVIKVDDLTDATLTPTALAQSLVGAGVAIKNVKYTGALRAAGTFTSSANVLGFTSGIVLSSGSARNVAGMNCEDGMSVDNGEPGDPDLNTIVGAGNTTNDAAVLEFDFVPTSSTISFQYVFGSEEYPDFVGAFNDVFGFFLTAPDGTPVNLALIPGTALPVSINDVNDGNTTVTPPIAPTNPQFYVNNQVQFSATGPLPPVDTELNGLTTVLGAQATVTPGLTYHIKLAVADANDFALDSNVFVQAGSLSSANVTVNPTSLAFASQAQGTTSASQPVTITNVGATTVTITSIAASTNFGETNACPATLATGTGTGSSCTVNVTFTPTATGTMTGTVTVTYTSAGSQTPQTTTITLTGTGTPATGGTLQISPTTLTFGSQAVGTTSATQTVSVSNAGGTAVTFTSIVTSGDFAGATLAQCPSLAVESEPCVFSITFKPTATGTRTGTITFTDNATGSPQTVTLTGTGTPGTATVTVTPSSLTFGSQALTTTSAPLSVTVMNTSSGPVNFTGFTVSGANAGDFGVPLPNTSSGCSPTGTLAAGASCTIGVVFTPSANGTRTATLNIADNATGSPQTVALSGAGVTSQVIIAIAPGGSSTATTVSGGTAYYGLVISGAPGVTGTVQLGCIPSSVLITCKVIPSSVTLTGGSTEVAFAIQTFCQGSTTATGFVPPVGGIGGGLGLLLVSMVFGGAMWTFRRNRRVALTFATLWLVAMGSAACNSLPQGPNGATPAGTYTLSLTTTLNGQTQTLNNFLTLVVK